MNLKFHAHYCATVPHRVPFVGLGGTFLAPTFEASSTLLGTRDAEAPLSTSNSSCSCGNSFARDIVRHIRYDHDHLSLDECHEGTNARTHMIEGFDHMRTLTGMFSGCVYMRLLSYT